MKIEFILVIFTLIISIIILIPILVLMHLVLPKTERKKNIFLKKLNDYWNRIISNNITLSWFIFLVALLLFFALSSIYNLTSFNNDFLEGVLVEMVGMLFDIIILFVLVNIISQRGEKRKRIEFLENQLDDFRGWDGDEAAFRVAGIIQRLGKEGVENYNLKYLHLGKCSKKIILKALKNDMRLASLKFADLRNTNLRNIFFIRVSLERANFSKAIFEKRVNIYNSQLSYIDFSEANIEGIKFSNANLTNANFDRCLMKSSSLHKANLTDANFRGADLRNSDLSKTNLERTVFANSDLRGVNFQGAMNLGTTLKGARVDSMDWLKRMKELKIKGIDKLLDFYVIQISNNPPDEKLFKEKNEIVFRLEYKTKPLGIQIVSGKHCPETGTWTTMPRMMSTNTTFEKKVEYIKKGETMPGIRDGRAVMWKLIDYDDLLKKKLKNNKMLG